MKSSGERPSTKAWNSSSSWASLELVGLLVALDAAEVGHGGRVEHRLVGVDRDPRAHRERECVGRTGVQVDALAVLALQHDLGEERGPLHGRDANVDDARPELGDRGVEEVVRHGAPARTAVDAHRDGGRLERADADGELPRGIVAHLAVRTKHDERGDRTLADDDALYVHLPQRHGAPLQLPCSVILPNSRRRATCPTTSSGNCKKALTARGGLCNISPCVGPVAQLVRASG